SSVIRGASSVSGACLSSAAESNSGWLSPRTWVRAGLRAVAASDTPPAAERLDLRRVVAELAEDGLGVLAESGRRTPDRGGRRAPPGTGAPPADTAAARTCSVD